MSPVKDTTLDESCLAVKRIQRNPDVAVEDLCIGRGLLSQLVDRRGQSCWYLLVNISLLNCTYLQFLSGFAYCLCNATMKTNRVAMV